MPAPTIVAASLSDQELKTSIDNLVKYVNKSVNDMATSFDKSIQSMEARLKTLGRTNLDSNGSSTGGTSRSVKQQKELTESIERNVSASDKQIKKNQEATMSFDNMADAKQKAAQSSQKTSLEEQAKAQTLKEEVASLEQLKQKYIQLETITNRRYDVSSIQTLRMRQHELEAGMRTTATEAAKSKKDVDELNASIEAYRRTIAALPKDATGIAQSKQIQKEINELTILRDVAAAEQQKWVVAGRQLSAEYENIKAQIRGIGQALIDAENKQQQATQSAQHYTEEIRKQAQAIRESQEFKTTGAYKFDAYGATHQVLANEKKYGSVEEQLLQIMQREAVYSREIYANQSESAQVTGKLAETQERIAKTEEEHLASLKTDEEKQREITKHLNEAKQIYADIQRNQSQNKNLSEGFRLESTIEDIKSLEQAYKNLDAVDKRSKFGQELKAYIQSLKNELVTLTDKMNDDRLMAANLGNNYVELSRKLQRLQAIYQTFNEEQRNSARGKNIADEIQKAMRDLSKIQRQMTTPTSLESVLGIKPKTLDDMAYKMQRLQMYRQSIDLTKPDAAAKIEQVDNAMKNLQKEMDKYMVKSKQIGEINNALSRSWNYMKNRLAFYFTVGASTQFVKQLIEIRSQYELNERALGILIGSAERGTQIFNELSQMALVSPYTLIELSSAAKQLTAYDIAAKDVVDTTRRLADMASAVGVPMERLTYALGQIKAYGYLNSRDARMFANAGIPLVKQLSEYYTELEGRMVSVGDVYDRMKKKAIGFNEVMSVINQMTDEGGKFFDFQAKMADTLKVRLANLTLAWNNMLNDIGKSEQGVLTTGIGLLRDLFLRWRDFDTALKRIAWTFGVLKAAQLLWYFAVRNTNKAIALETVLGQKLATVAKTLAASLRTLAFNPLTWIGVAVAALGSFVVAAIEGNTAMKEFNKTMREDAKGNYENIEQFLDGYRKLRNSLYETKEVTKDVDGVPTTYRVTTPHDINEDEANKAWEAVREQIELTTKSSDEYIARLMQIDNVSERLRQSFGILDEVKAVSAALKDLGNDGITITREWSAWWNLWLASDGLIVNLKDYSERLAKIADETRYNHWASMDEARNAAENGSRLAQKYVEDVDEAQQRFRKDLELTTESIQRFIEVQGWLGDETKINEAYKQLTESLINKNGLSPEEAYQLQVEMEEARSKAAKEALEARIADMRQALAIENDEEKRAAIKNEIEIQQARLDVWEQYNGRNKTEWERFTKELKAYHISEMTAMFRGMDKEQIKSLNFQEGEYKEWVDRMAAAYAKRHKMSIDEVHQKLKDFIYDANRYSIFIPLTISTEDKKSVYEQLGEYDKIIDDANKKIERLKTRIKELNEKQNKTKEETEELANANKELAQAEKDRAEAEAKGGHGKKEKKDERAANKAAKQAESELQKALKDELSTIDKVRSIYKDLTKEGMSHADAVERATRGWGETVNAINKVLQKNGLQKLDLTKFAGIENPRELVNMLESQLNILAGRGAKPAAIKELQTKINTLWVDVDKYDLTKITKGLNNELDKLKDEYELAVELDADPELGNVFTEMFGIDTTDFPKTIDEYMNRAQQEFDKMRKKRNFSAPLNIFKAGEKEWEDWGRQVGLVVDVLDENGNVIDKNTDALDKLTPKFKEAQGVAKKWAQDTIKATKELEYKLGDLAKKVEIEEAKLAVLEDQAANETNAKQKHLLELRVQEQKEAIEKLKMESIKLLPFYEDLFGDMYNVSVGRLKAIVRAAKEVMTPREGNEGVGYVQRTNDKGKVVYDIFAKDEEGNIKKTTVSLEEFIKINKQIDSVQQKIAESSPWEKIKDSFSKKDGGGIKNFATGIETIGSELQKIANITKEIGGFAEALGADRNTVEIINDVATSIGGVATAAQGIGQIASGDYLGGAASVISGVISTISAWMDNADKKITEEVEESEKAVNRLENAYKRLEYAVEETYGAEKYAAQEVALSNKKAQLAELQRQKQLEESRKSKDRDEEKIESLRGSIIDLEIEIDKATKDIVNDLLGISNVGDAAEEMVKSMIEAFKNGEDYMGVYEETFDKMIDNMIMKAIVSKVIGEKMNELWNEIDKRVQERASEERIKAEAMASVYDRQALEEERAHLQALLGRPSNDYSRLVVLDRLKNINAIIAEYDRVMEEYTKALTVTPEDVKAVGFDRDKWETEVKTMFDAYMDAFGVVFGQDSTKELSALQQGLQSVSEETASAVEAYLNGMSQQAYLRNDLLTQIRDTIQGWSMNENIGVQAQMLLQLQQSFQVQQSIESILQGVLNPSGRAFSVELIS